MTTERALDGARVLLLGASGVLGSELARRLHSHGSRVVLAGRDPNRLEEVATAIDGAPTIEFDIRSTEDCERVVSAAVRALGGLDGLVIASGVVAFGALEDMSLEALDEIIEVNLTGPLRVIRAASRHLDDGFVVLLTGVVAESPVGGLAAYSSAKAGLSAAATALTREMRRRGVRFIDARPPHTETGLAGRAIEGEAPRMPDGLDPGVVADRVVAAILVDERVVAASEFM